MFGLRMRRFEAREPVCALHGSGPLLAHGLNGAAIALQQCLRMPLHATWRRRSSHSSTSTTKGRGRHEKSLSTLVRTPQDHLYQAQGHAHGGSSNLKTAFLLNLAFTVIEIIDGLWTNSVAILSDAVHDLGDLLFLGLAWCFDRLSKHKATPRNTCGYRRYSLLGGLITAAVLTLGISFVLWQAATSPWWPLTGKQHSGAAHQADEPPRSLCASSG